MASIATPAPSFAPHRIQPVSLFDHVPVVYAVHVFRTSVHDEVQVAFLRPELDRLVGAKGRWSFDLEDRERILRVETRHVSAGEVIALLNHYDHHCIELD